MSQPNNSKPLRGDTSKNELSQMSQILKEDDTAENL